MQPIMIYCVESWSCCTHTRTHARTHTHSGLPEPLSQVGVRLMMRRRFRCPRDQDFASTCCCCRCCCCYRLCLCLYCCPRRQSAHTKLANSPTLSLPARRFPFGRGRDSATRPSTRSGLRAKSCATTRTSLESSIRCQRWT